MTLRDLLSLVRNEIDDVTAPYLWTDPELIEYAVDAENEAARRARLLIDSSTVAVCQIAVVAATAAYDLDSRVIFIRRGKLSSEELPLSRAQMRDLDNALPNWEADTGTPSHFVTDFETGKIRLYPIPTANTTLNLTVVRLPLADMNDLDESPEINARYHRSLRYWIMHRAYGKQDSETKDEKKSLENLAKFEQEFGRKSSAVDEEWIEREQAYDTFSGVF